MNSILAIFIGGGLGSVLRYGIGRGLAGMAVPFPIGTLAANILATAILAISILQISQRENTPEWVSLFLLTGFCGGFSTFSTFSVDTLKLFQNGHSLLALGNILISVLACILIAWIILRK